EEERPALLPLPPTRFEYYRIIERRVHVDAHIEVNGAYYSAPPRYVGTSVVVHVGTLWLRIIDARSKLCVREHVTIERGPGRHVVRSQAPKKPTAARSLCARFSVSLTSSNVMGLSASTALVLWQCQLAVYAFDSCAKHLPSTIRSQRSSMNISSSSPLALTENTSMHSPKEIYSMTNEELDRALRQLRLGGMADVLAIRAQQARAENLGPLDFIGMLVHDELERRRDRLVSRRIKNAGFRDVKTLDTFDWSFN